jgi:hypothetical protein
VHAMGAILEHAEPDKQVGLGVGWGVPLLHATGIPGREGGREAGCRERGAGCAGEGVVRQSGGWTQLKCGGSVWCRGGGAGGDAMGAILEHAEPDKQVGWVGRVCGVG